MKKVFGLLSAFCLLTSFSMAQTIPTLPVTEIPIEAQPDQTGNPIRAGIDDVVNNIEGSIIRDSDTDFESSLERVVAQINTIVNYLLGLLALVTLIYLIYHGFIMLFSLEKEDQFKKGLEGIKTASVALLGIGLSWIIVRFIFYVISLIA